MRSELRYVGRNRGAYTLIELLVVVAIIGVLMALTAGAAFKYSGTGKQRATEAVIQTIDDEIDKRMQGFIKKVKPDPLSRHQILAGRVVTITNEEDRIKVKRVNLIAQLEAMRGDFPQQFADFLPRPIGLASSAPTPADNVVPIASRSRALIEQEYRRLTGQTNSAVATAIVSHDHQTESGACLYLILKVGSSQGTGFDMSQIPGTFIRDTDGDGVPEIVDSWGTPMRFYRWPTDYLLYLIQTSNQISGGDTRNQNTMDPEKLLARTPWISSTVSQLFENNPNPATYDPTAPIGTGNYFRVRDPSSGAALSAPIYHMIVSAGADAALLPATEKWQAFGLVWDNAARPVPTGFITYSWPPPDLLAARMAQPVQTAGQLGAGAFGDNIVSRVIRAGQEAN